MHIKFHYININIIFIIVIIIVINGFELSKFLFILYILILKKLLHLNFIFFSKIINII